MEARTQVLSEGDGWTLNDGQPLTPGEGKEIGDGDTLTYECAADGEFSASDRPWCPPKPVKISAECAKERRLAYDTAMLFVEPIASKNLLVKYPRDRKTQCVSGMLCIRTYCTLEC